jgi:hypothetical protein
MTHRVRIGLLLAAACPFALAQAVVSARAGFLNFATGNVTLDSRRVSLRGSLRQMRDGQTLRTGKGRVEILLAPGIAMRIGEDSSVRIDDTRLEDTQVRIENGSAYVEVVHQEKDARLRILVGESETELSRNGVYRFDSAPALLRVYGGEASVLRRGTQLVAKRGQEVNLEPGEATLEELEFDPKSADPLHGWAAQRSFALFNTSTETRRQSNWQYLGDGWVWSKNYQIKFRSGRARQDNAWLDQQMRRSPIPRAETQQ